MGLFELLQKVVGVLSKRDSGVNLENFIVKMDLDSIGY
jgi:hypothetical protein